VKKRNLTIKSDIGVLVSRGGSNDFGEFKWLCNAWIGLEWLKTIKMNLETNIVIEDFGD